MVSWEVKRLDFLGNRGRSLLGGEEIGVSCGDREHQKKRKKKGSKTIIITEPPSQSQKKHTLPLTPSSNGRHQPPP